MGGYRADGGQADRVGERRWPTAAAVLLIGVLRITLPPQLRLNDAGPVLLVVLFGLVIVLILADRGPIGRQAAWRRVLTMLPIALITIANGGSTVRLVYGILFAELFTQQARTLLAAGGVIWLTNPGTRGGHWRSSVRRSRSPAAPGRAS